MHYIILKTFQMRLLLNYKGINKILSKVENYGSIVQFVNQNFFLKMSKWTLSYIDSDGDSISLDSDLDVQTMLDTANRDHLKVYIKDIEVTEEIQIGDESQSKNNLSEEKKQNQIHVEEEKKAQEALEIPEVSEEKKVMEEREEPKMDEVQKNQCRWKEHWKKKMEEKMAKFVDERVESLIPCLVKKIEEKMNKTQPKVLVKDGVVHEVKCLYCGISPIVGIRYKCTKCPLFNYCESCEESVSHHHNMIKMRFVEEAEKIEEQFQKKNWSGEKCRWGWKNHDNKEKEEDSTLIVTRKCFRMSKFFGEKPENYRTFVEENVDKKFHELTALFVEKNGENVGISDSTSEKIEQRLQKISFYFQEPKENFVDAVKKNPASNLKELIKIINEERKRSEIVEEKKEEEVIAPEEKVEPEIVEIKDEEKMVVMEQKIPEAPKEDLPQPEEPKSFWGFFKKPQYDAKKKNEYIILMKDYFGPENVFEYIKFFDANSNLEIDELVAKYIEKVTSEK